MTDANVRKAPRGQRGALQKVDSRHEIETQYSSPRRPAQPREIEPTHVELIRAGERLRSINPDTVDRLAESMRTIGLQNPILVRHFEDSPFEGDRGDATVLVAGAHRLAAAKKLGWEKIDCVFLYGVDDVGAKLHEIAENLHRAELTVQERAEHIEEWRKLSEEKAKDAQLAHPGGKQPKDAGVSKVAKELGVERREVQRAKKIAAIAPEAKAAARDAKLDDNQSALLKVAAMPKGEQVKAVERIADEREAQKRANLAARKETAQAFFKTEGAKARRLSFEDVCAGYSALDDADKARFDAWHEKVTSDPGLPPLPDFLDRRSKKEPAI